MALTMDIVTIADPDGAGAALLLKGDWVFVRISDGDVAGWGEATHNGDDGRCARVASDLFDAHLRDLTVSPETIATFARHIAAAKPDFLTATAASALNQALYEFLARREGVPVWKLFCDTPARTDLPVYVTINRALCDRDQADYHSCLTAVRDRGFTHFKCAPFEGVTGDGDQVEQAAAGLEQLQRVAASFGDLGMRIDFHKRFRCEVFLDSILPIVEQINPEWIEEPFAIGPDYLRLRRQTRLPVAAGELYFGTPGFADIANGRWADVIMPDVKHVGGFGPLVEVCRLAETHGLEVSPHNPSGPVATMASLHAAAVSAAVTSLEMPFDRRGDRPRYGEPIADGRIHLIDAPGWGIDFDRVFEDVAHR